LNGTGKIYQHVYPINYWSDKEMRKISSIFVLFGILVILITSGCTQQQPTIQPTAQPTIQPTVQQPTATPAIEQPTVNLSAGNYIVDNKGKSVSSS